MHTFDYQAAPPGCDLQFYLLLLFALRYARWLVATAWRNMNRGGSPLVKLSILQV